MAQHFHQLGQPVNLFNSRSFSSIANYLVGHVRQERIGFGEAIGHKDSLKGIILGWLAKPFVTFAIALVKWEINAGSAFKSIPEAYKDYVVVRSRKDKRGDRIDDGVIPHYASIHEDLTTERRLKKAEIDKKIAMLDDRIQKADLSATAQLVHQRETLVEAREKIKSARKMETEYPYENGHNLDLNDLYNRSGTNAQRFFREFVQRTEKDHGVKAEQEISVSLNV